MNRRKLLLGLCLVPLISITKISNILNKNEPEIYWEGTRIPVTSPCPYIKIHPFDVYDLFVNNTKEIIVLNNGSKTGVPYNGNILKIGNKLYQQTTSVPPITNKYV